MQVFAVAMEKPSTGISLFEENLIAAPTALGNACSAHDPS